MNDVFPAGSSVKDHDQTLSGHVNSCWTWSGYAAFNQPFWTITRFSSQMSTISDQELYNISRWWRIVFEKRIVKLILFDSAELVNFMAQIAEIPYVNSNVIVHWTETRESFRKDRIFRQFSKTWIAHPCVACHYVYEAIIEFSSVLNISRYGGIR